VSMSARKRRTRREVHRLGRKRFRAAEKRVLRGDRHRASHFTDSWSGAPGMRQRDLPTEDVD
jgi:hypothetical protein